ncbi:MAG: prolyl oligopeptidase family serine peptidase [Planctomycetota bacterium]|nr:prolyl oligopeptidase family serine peptidase [Planctomycetota bacterium]MDA1213507.1 prolyl oligopeptidase family serine peptidase [Planctomycetota bacterium]
MRIFSQQSLSFGLVLSLLSTCVFAAPPRLPRDNLLLFRDSEGKTQPVKSLDDWQRRREEIIRGMEDVMGKLPGNEKRSPLDVKIEKEFDGGTYIRRLITYTSEPGCRTPAYLLIPKDVLAGKRQSPAILCLHGTNDVVGHGSIVGLGDNKHREYARELAERGFVTFAPSYPGLAKYKIDILGLGWESGTLKAVWDNIRGLDYLETLTFIEGNKFAAIGHSLGGHNSVYSAVFDDRIVAVVTSCGLDSYLDYMGGDPNRWDAGKGWCQTLYMPKLSDYKGRLEEIPFDFHEMIGALSPRDVLIIAPLKDHNFQYKSVDRVAKASREIYSLQGHPDRLKVLHPDCEHDFPPEMRETAYEFIVGVLSRQ